MWLVLNSILCFFLFYLNSLVGTFACIEVHLALQRNINLYLQQLYLPSTLIVALSFIAFWIDYKSHPARTLLSLLSIVTVTTKAEGTKSPPLLLLLLSVTHLRIYTYTRSLSLVFCLHSFSLYCEIKSANEESFFFVILISFFLPPRHPSSLSSLFYSRCHFCRGFLLLFFFFFFFLFLFSFF